MDLYNNFDDIKKFIVCKNLINGFYLSDGETEYLNSRDEWTIEDSLYYLTGVKNITVLNNLITQIDALKRLDPNKIDQSWIVHFIGIDNISSYLKSCGIEPFGDYFKQFLFHSESKVYEKISEFDFLSRKLATDWEKLSETRKKVKKEVIYLLHEKKKQKNKSYYNKKKK